MSDRIILLVEDNPDDEAITLRALKKNNLASQVVVVRDGEEALDYLFAAGPYKDRDGSKLPAVILLDLTLPKIDGLGVLKRLRSDQGTRRLPVVVLTSSKEDQDRLNSYSYGSNSYIRKPVNFDNFVDAAGQLGLSWLVRNESPPAPVKTGKAVLRQGSSR